MLKKRLRSFKFAFQGVRTLMSTQPNAWIHFLAMCVVLFMGWYFELSKVEWCLVIFAICSVFAAEGFNTALEFLTDLVSPDYHELAGKTKDVAAGAVLITAIGAAVVGLIIFLPKILALF